MLSPTDINIIISNSLKGKISVLFSHRIYKGGMNFVYEVKTNKSYLIIKAYPKSRNQIANKEFSILKLIVLNNIDVPRVITTGIYNDIGYIIYEKIVGEILCYDNILLVERERFSDEIVDSLFQINKIKFSFCGSITEDKEDFVNWNDFLKFNITTGLNYLKMYNLLKFEDYTFLSEYMENHSLLEYNFKDRIGLVWSDFKQDNILIKRDNSITFLDFEACFSGDILLSLGYLFAREGNSVFYSEIATKFQKTIKFTNEDIYFYSIFRLLRISKYLNLLLPTGLDRAPVLDYFPGIKESITMIYKRYE